MVVPLGVVPTSAKNEPLAIELVQHQTSDSNRKKQTRKQANQPTANPEEELLILHIYLLIVLNIPSEYHNNTVRNIAI